MRYEYTVTKDSGEAELIKAMSWKKMIKSLLLKHPKFTGGIVYINKKGRKITRSFRNGRDNTYGDNQYDFVH
jgi:hypothetical protein